MEINRYHAAIAKPIIIGNENTAALGDKAAVGKGTAAATVNTPTPSTSLDALAGIGEVPDAALSRDDDLGRLVAKAFTVAVPPFSPPTAG